MVFGVVCCLCGLMAAHCRCFFFSCFVLFVVLCLVDPVWHWDHHVGEEGAGCFVFLWIVPCLLSVMLWLLLVSLAGADPGWFLRGSDLIKLPYLLYVYGQTDLSKQCRHRSDAAERGVWSGSTLFATHSAILQTLTVSKMHLLKRNTVEYRYLEFQGTVWNTSRYPYLDISALQNWWKK